jgi:hypothetical protein
VPREALSVWLDDRRAPPDDGWVWVKTPAEAIALLKSCPVERLSLVEDRAFRPKINGSTETPTHGSAVSVGRSR